MLVPSNIYCWPTIHDQLSISICILIYEIGSISSTRRVLTRNIFLNYLLYKSLLSVLYGRGEITRHTPPCKLHNGGWSGSDVCFGGIIPGMLATIRQGNDGCTAMSRTPLLAVSSAHLVMVEDRWFLFGEHWYGLTLWTISITAYFFPAFRDENNNVKSLL